MSHGHSNQDGNTEPRFQFPPTIQERLRLVHHHAGYLRARANAFIEGTGDNAALAAARAAAESTAGFRRWSHNPKTGSVVVEYEPGAVEPDDLLKHMAASAGLNGIEHNLALGMNREELVRVFMDSVQEVNRVVREATGGAADLRELVPMGLLLTSAVSFVLHDQRGRLPRWDSALYRAYRIFFNWHRRELREREEVLG
jgi:hypothetical protein